MFKYTYNTKFSFSIMREDGFVIPHSRWHEIQSEYLSQFSILSDLCDNGFAEFTIDTCEVEANEVLNLSEIDKQILSLPSQYPYEIYIQSDGQLNQSSFIFNYGFYDFAPNGTRFRVERKGPIIGIEDRVYLLSADQFLICEAIDEFNSLPETERTFQNNLKRFAEIKRFSKAAASYLDSYLESQDCCQADKIKIDIEFNNGILEIFPKIEIENPSAFTNIFDKFPGIRDVYSVSNGESGTLRIVFDEKQKAELRNVKNNRKINDPKIIQEIVEHPERFFDHDNIDTSIFYSDRVIDGYRIGLTATPKAEGDRDTYHLFGLEPNMPTYAYELDDAVEQQFLVPPMSVSVPVKFHRDGIKYHELTREEQVAYEEMFADPITGEYPDEINSTALNTWLFNADTVDHVLAYLMANGIKVAGGDRLGKTIIFARSHKHALFIKERFDRQFPHLGGHFCKVIDNYEEYAYTILKDFSEKDRAPHIAVSVDMLDTGIDVPEIVNLVFYKLIRSSSKFWQMIGRGTRLCKDLFGPGIDKKEFIIFDFCENFEFFGKKPKGLDGKRGRSLTERLFEQRLKLIFHLQKNGSDSSLLYAEELRSFLLDQVNKLEEDSFLVRQHWRVVEKYRDPFRWNALAELEVKEVMDHIAPLVFEPGDDEQAKRFDGLCYNMQLDLLQKGSIADNYMNETISTAAALSKKGAIPMVAAKMDQIKSVQTAAWWQDVSVQKIEVLRKDLRSLIRFIESSSGMIFYCNFDDEIMSTVSDPQPVIATINLDSYRKRMSEYILRNREHITIHKLRTNQPISKSELGELDRMLFAQGENGTHEQFVKAYGEMPLGQFVRSIVGLDQSAVNAAFSSFINNPSLNAAQIRFLNLIIQYLSTNGAVEEDKLFEAPFTEISSHGLLGVFNQQEAESIVKVIGGVNSRATAI